MKGITGKGSRRIESNSGNGSERTVDKECGKGLQQSALLFWYIWILRVAANYGKAKSTQVISIRFTRVH